MSALKTAADVVWDIVQIIGPATILGWFGVRTVKDVRDTRNAIDVAADALADRAVKYAANWARQELRQRMAPVPAKHVEDTAVDFFQSWGTGSLRKWSADKVRKWIRAAYERQRKNGKAPRKALVVDAGDTPPDRPPPR